MSPQVRRLPSRCHRWPSPCGRATSPPPILTHARPPAAAGLLLLAGWGRLADDARGAALADPMCGSGTLLIEAAHIATRTAPGSFRRFWPFRREHIARSVVPACLRALPFASSRLCCDPRNSARTPGPRPVSAHPPALLPPACRSRWPDYDAAAWREAWDAAQEAVRPWDGAVWGNDMHAGALGLALRDCEAAGVRSVVRLHHGDARAWQLPRPPQLVCTNPPWWVGGQLGVCVCVCVCVAGW